MAEYLGSTDQQTVKIRWSGEHGGPAFHIKCLIKTLLSSHIVLKVSILIDWFDYTFALYLQRSAV